MISKKLGSHFSYDFLEVIRIRPLQVEAFELKDSSVIFSSVNAVQAFFANQFRINENFLDPDFNKIYAVGAQTKKELRKHGFGTFKVVPHAKALADFIVKNSSKETFIHFCGNLAIDVLNQSLPLQNIAYQKVPVYETQLTYPKVVGEYDAVCFFSPSGARSFAKYNPLDAYTIFSIGETTENEIKKYTKQPIITSRKRTLDDLMNHIAEQYAL